MDNRTYTYTVLLERDPEVGGYTVTCPALPAVVTEGDTVEEAMDMAKEAITLYLQSLQKDGITIPEESGPIVSPVTVDLARA